MLLIQYFAHSTWFFSLIFLLLFFSFVMDYTFGVCVCVHVRARVVIQVFKLLSMNFENLTKDMLKMSHVWQAQFFSIFLLSTHSSKSLILSSWNKRPPKQLDAFLLEQSYSPSMKLWFKASCPIYEALIHSFLSYMEIWKSGCRISANLSGNSLAQFLSLLVLASPEFS